MRKKRRNRLSSGDSQGQGFSSLLRKAIHLINVRQTEEALRVLEEAAGDAASPARKAKIATLTAKSQASLGRYDDAISQFASARNLAKQDDIEQSHWLPAVLGQIRALLKAQRSGEASTVARTALEEAAKREKRFASISNVSSSQLKNLGSIRVGARPLRTNVVLTRLAVTFWEEGYAEEAKHFLLQAIEASPNGASRARQTLAAILLQEDSPSEAEQYARESLQMGRFQAKTVASWPLLIAARSKQGKPLLDQSLLRALRRTATGSPADRSLASIIMELRRRSDASWKELASKAFHSQDLQDPVIRFELGKILLAEARLTSNHRDAQRIAWELFADPLLSRNETTAVAKAIVESGLMSGKLGNRIAQVQRSVRDRFGPDTVAAVTHGMALSAMMAKSYDLARGLLETQCHSLEKGSEQWSKGKWALASMEAALENYSAAAKLSLDIADQSDVPPRFRLQAFFNWMKAAKNAAEAIDIAEAQKRVETIVAYIDDFRSLLDAARQLTLAGEPFRKITHSVTVAAEAQAVAAFHATKDPSKANGILNHLARRQYYDLSRTEQLISFWESLSEEKVGWLWTRDSRFWETISLIGESYFEVDRQHEGESLFTELLADSTVPESARIFLLVPFAERLRTLDRMNEAWPLFENSLLVSPDHRLAAHANYWIALRAFKQHNRGKCEKHALAVRKCLSPKPGFLWEWNLDAKAALLLASLYGGSAQVDTRLYKPDFLNAMTKALERDLKSLMA